jgi:hypothetical protein
MKKLSLSPESLRVDSFPTETLARVRPGTVQGHAAGWLVTRPECAATVYDTCDCRAEMMERAILTTRPIYTCPECASPVGE